MDGPFFCWGLAGVQHCEIPIGLYSFMMKIWTSDKNAEGLKAECLRETLFVSRQLGLARSFTKELKTWQLAYRFSAFCGGLKWVSKNKVIAVGETLDFKSFQF